MPPEQKPNYVRDGAADPELDALRPFAGISVRVQ